MAMLPPDPIYIYKGTMTAVSCLIFNETQNSQRIYAGTQSGLVHIWTLKSQREIGRFRAGDNTCLSICISGNLVITLVKCGQVCFWEEDDKSWTMRKLIEVEYFGFCKCELFQNILYTPLVNSKCQLISVKTMETTTTVDLSADSFGDLMALKVFEAEKKRLMLVAHEGCTLCLWDVENSKRISSLGVDECPLAIDYDVPGNKGICGNPSDNLLIFSINKNLELIKERKVAVRNPGVASVRVRGDGKLVAVGCWDGKLRLYSWKTMVLLAVLDTHSATVQDVSFSRGHEEGGKFKYFLAAGSQDSRISLWDLYN